MAKAVMTRADFIKYTGIFVSPFYFDQILTDYRNSDGEAVSSFCKRWKDEHKSKLVESVLDGTVQYSIDDVSLTLFNNSMGTGGVTAIEMIESLCSEIEKLENLYISKCRELQSVSETMAKVNLNLQELKLHMEDAFDPNAKFRILS
ncbi:MAG TPA: hypothetical protein VHO71_04185 [Caproiciproducens sp.]|nr:hypothetical protein [Caproiciproducens sp.]